MGGEDALMQVINCIAPYDKMPITLLTCTMEHGSQSHMTPQNPMVEYLDRTSRPSGVIYFARGYR